MPPRRKFLAHRPDSWLPITMAPPAVSAPRTIRAGAHFAPAAVIVSAKLENGSALTVEAMGSKKTRTSSGTHRPYVALIETPPGEGPRGQGGRQPGGGTQAWQCQQVAEV